MNQDLLIRFNQYKYYILQELISYYGNKYKDLIIHRFNNTYFDFTSLPIYNDDKDDMYNDFITKDRCLKNMLDEHLLNYIAGYVKECNISLIYDNKDDFLKAFYRDNYDESSIDFFTKKYDIYKEKNTKKNYNI